VHPGIVERKPDVVLICLSEFMRAFSMALSVLCHLIAILFSAGFLIVVAVATYFVCAAIGNDAGGPMVPFLIPLFAVIGGIVTPVIVYFPLGLIFKRLLPKSLIRLWASPLLFFVLAFLFFVLWGGLMWRRLPSLDEFGLCAICGLFFTGGFTVYWLVLAVGQGIFERLGISASARS
jgi:hypothetical protein